MRDVRIERVRGLPLGAKMLIDTPDGEEPIVWVDEDDVNDDQVRLIAHVLLRHR